MQDFVHQPNYYRADVDFLCFVDFKLSARGPYLEALLT